MVRRPSHEHCWLASVQSQSHGFIILGGSQPFPKKKFASLPNGHTEAGKASPAEPWAIAMKEPGTPESGVWCFVFEDAIFGQLWSGNPRTTAGSQPS